MDNQNRELSIDELDTVSAAGDDWTFLAAMQLETIRLETRPTDTGASDQAKPAAKPVKIKL